MPADEREALFDELCANDDGEPDAEGASKRAQFLSLLATESAGAPAHPTSSFPSPSAAKNPLERARMVLQPGRQLLKRRKRAKWLEHSP